VKKETHLRWERRLPPLSPLGHHRCPIYPCHPYPPKGRRGQGTLRCASEVAATSSGAKAEHGHCRRRTEFPVLRDGELVHQKAQPNASPFIDGRGCRSMPHAAIPYAPARSAPPRSDVCLQTGRVCRGRVAQCIRDGGIDRQPRLSMNRLALGCALLMNKLPVPKHREFRSPTAMAVFGLGLLDVAATLLAHRSVPWPLRPLGG